MSAALDGSNEVVRLLRMWELEQHASALLAGGFDTLAALAAIEDVDLKDLGLPRGHGLKLRRHLREHMRPTEAGERPALGEPELQPVFGEVLPLAEDLEPHKFPSSCVGSRQSSSTLPPDSPCFYSSDKIEDDVQKSWDRIREIGILYAGEVLYKKVFELNPLAKDYLPWEVISKYRITSLDQAEADFAYIENATLARMFSIIFNQVGNSIVGLHDLGKLIPMLLHLGARHIGYGEFPEPCWDVVGQAVNLTLHQLLGELFTPDVEHVWTLGYSFIASIMLQGMREAKAAAALQQA